MLAFAYRPGWAGPIDKVDDWPADKVSALPDHVRPLFFDRNVRHWDFHGANKRANMKRDAPGMNPSRWERRHDD